jgi:hypothetical protein
MWKPEHRRTAARQGLRYPSDLTEAEWALVAPMIPPARGGRRPRDLGIREVLNAIFYFQLPPVQRHRVRNALALTLALGECRFFATAGVVSNCGLRNSFKVASFKL